jgi:hypothetical protein
MKRISAKRNGKNFTRSFSSHFSANRWEDLPEEEEIHEFLIETKMVVPEE